MGRSVFSSSFSFQKRTDALFQLQNTTEPLDPRRFLLQTSSDLHAQAFALTRRSGQWGFVSWQEIGSENERWRQRGAAEPKSPRP